MKETTGIKAYIDIIFKRFKMKNIRPLSTPIEKGLRLSKRDGPANDLEKLHALDAQAVDNLMCAMLCTRPDISHVVGLVSRNQSNLGVKQWQLSSEKEYSDI